MLYMYIIDLSHRGHRFAWVLALEYWNWINLSGLISFTCVFTGLWKRSPPCIRTTSRKCCIMLTWDSKFPETVHLVHPTLQRNCFHWPRSQVRHASITCMLSLAHSVHSLSPAAGAEEELAVKLCYSCVKFLTSLQGKFFSCMLILWPVRTRVLIRSFSYITKSLLYLQ